jgi:phage I-like protein
LRQFGNLSFVGEHKKHEDQRSRIVALATYSSAAFDAPTEGQKRQAPSEFRLFRYGVNATAKGDFIFDEESAASTMARYIKQGVPYMGDYEHQSLSQPPIKAPASITEFVPEIRSDSTGRPELWATDVHWTSDAQAEIEQGQYRLYSPAFMPTVDEHGTPTPGNHIEYLINVALTNLPATYGLEPLVAASSATTNKEPIMDETQLKELGAKLADAEKARDEFKALCGKMSATVAKLTGKSFEDWAKEESDEHDAGADGQDDAAEEAKALKSLKSTVLALTGKTDLLEASGALTSLVAQAKELVSLKATQAETAKALAEREFSSTLEKAIVDGKIPPFEKESLIALKAELGTEKALKWLNGRLNAMPGPIVQLKSPTQPTPAEAVDPMALAIAANCAGAFGGVEKFKALRLDAQQIPGAPRA